MMKRLIKVFWQKELIFWARIKEIKSKTNYMILFFVTLLLGISHYAFAGMHFLFECSLLAFKKSAFELNMTKLEKQLKLT